MTLKNLFKIPLTRSFLLLFLSFSLPTQARILFEDDFSETSETKPSGDKWETIVSGGEVQLNGDGEIVLKGIDRWNAAMIRSRFSIPRYGDATYEVEFWITLLDYGFQYLGIASGSPSEHRGFLLQGAMVDGKNPWGVNATTGNTGRSGGISSDHGIPMNSGKYPIGEIFGLRLRLNANGSLDWAMNTGQGFEQLTIVGRTEEDRRRLNQWPKNQTSPYRVVIDANGWQASDKRLLVDKVLVRKLAAGEKSQEKKKESGAGYLENPNIILQYSDEETLKASPQRPEPLFESKESPTGSGVWYARAEIEPVRVPKPAGEYYETKIPATLDLAHRAELAVHAMTSLADPRFDYEIFGWIGNPKSGVPIMKHSYHDYNGGQAKWLMMLPLMRTMSGSTENLEVDKGMMETMFRMIGEDGLYYIPVRGMSWVGEPDSISPWTEPGVEQVYDVWPNGRALLCLVTWYARNPNDVSLKKNIERMIDGFLEIAIKKDDYAYLPRHFYDGHATDDPHVPVRGTAVTSQSTVIGGVARYYALTGYEPALELGQKLVNYWMGPAHLLEEDGDWDYGPGTHFHGTTMALIGLLDWAVATDDDAMKERIRQAYEFGRRNINVLLGWVPEGYPSVHNNTEPCGIGDMTVLASKLSYYGVGDYWEDVERYARNLLSEAQVTDSWFVERIAAQHPGDQPIREPLESADNVAEKMIGSFIGMVGANGHMNTVASHCCTGNGNRGFYFAWRNIVTAEEDVLKVNLLLNRASQWADIDSHLPYRGQVDIRMKKDMQLQVRIPSWVQDVSEVECTLDGRQKKCRLEGRYLNVGRVRKGQTAGVRFPLEEKTLEIKVHELTFWIQLKGFNVVNIYPRSTMHPFFDNKDYLQDKTLWKKVVRFAPETEKYW